MNFPLQITLTLKSLLLPVNFACQLFILHKTKTIGISDRYLNGQFIFHDTKTKVSFTGITDFAQWEIVLKTARGKFGGGSIKVECEMLVEGQQFVEIGVSKCYQKGKIVVCIEDIRWGEQSSNRSLNLPSASLPLFPILSQKDSQQSKQMLKVLSSTQGIGFKESFSTGIQNPNIITSIEQKYKGRIEEMRVANMQKEKVIKELNKKVGKKEREISQLNESMGLMQQDIEDFKMKIGDLSKYVFQLENTHKQRSQKLQNSIDYGQDYLKQYVREYASTIDNLNKDLNIKDQMIARLIQCEALMDNKAKRLERELEEMKKALQVVEEDRAFKEEDGKELLRRCQKLQFVNKSLVSQTLSMQNSLNELNSLKQQNKNITNSLKSLQDQLTISNKYRLQKEDNSNKIIDKIKGQMKKRIEGLVAEMAKYRQQLGEVGVNLRQKERQAEELIAQLEQANKKCTQFEGTLVLMRDAQRQFKISQKENRSTIIKLQKEGKDLQAELATSMTENQSLKSAITNLQSQFSSQSTVLIQTQQCLQKANFCLQKSELQQALDLQQKDYTHKQCRQKEMRLTQMLQAQRKMIKQMEQRLGIGRSRSKDMELQVVKGKLWEEEARSELEGLKVKEQVLKNRLFLVQGQKKELEKTLANVIIQVQSLQANLSQKETSISNLKSEVNETKCKYENILMANYLKDKKLTQVYDQNKVKNMRIQEFQSLEIHWKRMLNEEKIKSEEAKVQEKGKERELEMYLNKSRAQIMAVIGLGQKEEAVSALVREYRKLKTQFEVQGSANEKKILDLSSTLSKQQNCILALRVQNQKITHSLSANMANLADLQSSNSGLQSSLEVLTEEHNQLLSIHEQYIFTYNRYKIDKEYEIQCLRQQNAMLRDSLMEEGQKREAAQKQNKRIQLENSCFRANIQKMEEQMKGFKKEVGKLMGVVGDLQEKERFLKNKISKLNEELGLKNEQFAELFIKNEMTQSNIQSLTHQVSQQKQTLSILEQFIEKNNKNIQQKDRNIQQLDLQLFDAKMLNQRVQQEKQRLIEEGKGFKQEIRKSKEKLIVCQEERGKLEGRLGRLENKLLGEIAKVQQGNARIKKLCEDKQQNSQAQQTQKKQAQQTMQLKVNQLCLLKQQLDEVEQKNRMMRNQVAEMQSRHSAQEQQMKTMKQKYETMQTQFLIAQTQSNERYQELLTKCQTFQHKIEQAEKQLCEKQEALFSVTGKLNEIELLWQGEKRKMVIRESEQKLENESRIEEIVGIYQQKIGSLQADMLIMENRKAESEEQIRQMKHRIQVLKIQVRDGKDLLNKKEKILSEELVGQKQKEQRILQNLKDKQDQLQSIKQDKRKLEEEKVANRAQLRTHKQNTYNAETQITVYQQKIRFFQNSQINSQRKLKQNEQLYQTGLHEYQEDIKREFEIFMKALPNQSLGLKQLMNKVLKFLPYTKNSP